MIDEKTNNEKSSSFHDESSKQQRKNKIKEEIHSLNTDLKHLHQDDYGMQVYGYQLVFENLNSLFSEISNDLILAEKISIEIRKQLIETILIIEPPHEKIKNNVTHEPKILFNPNKFLRLKKLLFDYQLLIFELEDKHLKKISSGKIESEI